MAEQAQDIDSSTKVLLAFMKEQWTQARQSENQRATLTNFLIVIFIALQGFIVQKQFALDTLVLAAVIIVLGIFGVIASAKYYERFRLSTNRVGEIMKHLDKMYPSSQLRMLQDRADVEHKKRYPRLHRLRLHYIWNVLHAIIALFGMINAIIILVANKII
jgi:hypothetical protein